MKKNASYVILACLTFILFCVGTVQVIARHFDTSQPLISRMNILAFAMAALFTTGEIVFLWGDITLARAKALSKKIASAIVLLVLAGTMTGAVIHEFALSDEEIANATAAKVIGESSAQQREQATSNRERAAIATASIQGITSLYKNKKQDVMPYALVFMTALAGFVILHFCQETKKPREKGRGNLLVGNEALESKVKAMGFAPESAKAYKVNGGYAIHHNGRYSGFIKDERV